MRALLLVTLLAPACRAAGVLAAVRRLTDVKSQLTTACDQLKSTGATLAASGNDVICKSTAAATDITGFKGYCAPLTTAAEALPNTETCSEYTTNLNALCDALVACDFTNPCFPSEATVTRADGTIVRIDALKEGDEIVAATAEGTLSTDVVSLLSIAKPEANASEYVVLTTADHKLTLTAGHHVPVGASCCSTAKVAKEIAVGDTVHMVKAGGIVATTVVTKSLTHASGLHSPVLTSGGFPVVNGLVTAFDSIDKVTLAKYGLASLLKACKATGTCDSFRETFLGEDRKYIDA